MRFRLQAVGVTNLRGFADTRLPISDGTTLLVGPNNAGKTSVLRLLDWALDPACDAALSGARGLTAAEEDLLVPARDTRNAARRLTLVVQVRDGRSRTRYLADGESAELRIGVTADGNARINVGPPRRGESADAQNRALGLELLNRLRADMVFTLIPASRDASSETFREALRAAAVAKLEQRALHARQAGAPAEYRVLKRARDEINKLAGEVVGPLWDEMRDAIPRGLVREAEIAPDVDPQALVAWLAERTVMRLVTGEHDVNQVPAVEVGSGLQSLLELAINRSGGVAEGLDWVIGLEEPEAFLHPAAQRSLARILRTTQARLLVSTHSPVIVDEAEAGEVVLVRRHKFYPQRLPRLNSDAARRQINSALLTGHGAEMCFSSSVLLVEGEGDRLFFERLRRRLAQESGDGRLDELGIVPAGAKTAFAPWIRLLRSYGDEGDRPIGWLILADDDAAAEVRAAYSEAGVSLPIELVKHLQAQKDLQSQGVAQDVLDVATHRVNREARATETRIHLMPGELEGGMTSKCSDDSAASLAGRLERPDVTTKEELRQMLVGRKAPWMRGILGDQIPASEISDDVAVALERWLEPVAGTSDSKHIIESFRQS
jgi:hypothetical protein